MTRVLDRYIFLQLAIASIAVTAVLVIAAVLTKSLTLFKKVVSGDLPLGTFFDLIFLLMPSMVAVILPISVFAATLFVYEKLSSDSELVVLRATGVSTFRISMPAYVLALIATLLLYAVTFYFLPASYGAYKTIQRSQGVSLAKTLIDVGVFKEIRPGVTVFVGGKDEQGRMTEIILHDERKAEAPTTVTAKSAELFAHEGQLQVILYDGVRQTIEASTGIPSTLVFDKTVYKASEGDNNRRTLERSELKPRELYVHELAHVSQTAETDKKRSRYASELHDRIATPLLVIGFVALALSVLLSGDINRRGTIKRILLSIVLVSCLQILAFFAKNLIKNDLSFFWTIYLAVFSPIFLAIIWPYWIRYYTNWLIGVSTKSVESGA